jgi:hypothetical protein
VGGAARHRTNVQRAEFRFVGARRAIETTWLSNVDVDAADRAGSTFAMTWLSNVDVDAADWGRDRR